MAIIIPQIRIFRILNYLLGYVKTDLATKISASVESEAWLYRVFFGIEFGSFDFYTQIKALIQATDEKKKKLELVLGWDKDRATLPTIHIHTPMENKGRINGIGVGFDEVEYFENADSTVTYSFNRSFLSNYEIIASGGSREEVTAIYELVKTLMIAGSNMFLYEFPSFEFSGRDIMLKPELIPTGIFLKSVMIQLDYSLNVPELIATTTTDEVNFTGEPIES